MGFSRISPSSQDLQKLALGGAAAGGFCSPCPPLTELALDPCKIDSRERFIDSDAFDPPYYCSGEVARSRALQPQQYVRARCLQNACENHYYSPQSHYVYKKKQCFVITFATRSGLPDPSYQILASTSWPPDPGFQTLATRSWLPNPGFEILATIS